MLPEYIGLQNIRRALIKRIESAKSKFEARKLAEEESNQKMMRALAAVDGSESLDASTLANCIEIYHRQKRELMLAQSRKAENFTLGPTLSEILELEAIRGVLQLRVKHEQHENEAIKLEFIEAKNKLSELTDDKLLYKLKNEIAELYGLVRGCSIYVIYYLFLYNRPLFLQKILAFE